MIKFYTTHCPKCKILKLKLDKLGLKYEESEDIDELIRLGFRFAPVLQVDDQYLDFSKANAWLNQQGGKN